MPPTKKTSISLDPSLENRAKQRADELGFANSFSAYIAKLIRDDLATNPDHTILREQPAIKYPAARTPQTGKRRIPKSKEN